MTILEPGEEKTWEYRERSCRIVKNELGHWCGYTQTSLRSFTGNTFDCQGEEPVQLLDIHGGMTYGPDSDGWVGFDCGHSRDLCLDEHGEPWGTMYVEHGQEPLQLRRHGSVEACEETSECIVWRLMDVRHEVHRLADQLILLEQFVDATTDS